jgi:hypothetical protein
VNDIIKKLVAIAAAAEGPTTEAGLRNELKGAALPVLFDEAERTGGSSASRIEAIIELMMSASSSEGRILKGTAQHGVSGTQVLLVRSHSCPRKASQPGGQMGCTSAYEKSKHAGTRPLHSQQMWPYGSGGSGWHGQRRPLTSQSWFGNGQRSLAPQGCPVQLSVMVSKHSPTPQGVGAAQTAVHSHVPFRSGPHCPATVVPSAHVREQDPLQLLRLAHGPAVGDGVGPQVALQRQPESASHTPP